MASEPARARLLSAILSLVIPVTFGHMTPAINFSMKHTPRVPAPFALVLGCSRPLVGVHKTPHPLLFLPPAMQAAFPTSSSNITRFGCLVSSMRVENPANGSCLLRIIASMLSLPVLISVPRYEIGWSVRLFFRQPMQRVRKLWWARHSCVVVARARAPSDATVQHCLEYLGS